MVSEIMISKFPKNWILLNIEWHPTLNGDLSFENMKEKDRTKIWWQHLDSKTNRVHEWPTAFYYIIKTGRCEVCDNRHIQAGVNDLATINP